MRYAVLLAGGKGERLWPFSREAHPKQFLALLGPHSMLSETWERVKPVVGSRRAMVVTSEALAKQAARQMKGLPPGRVIAEPEGKNTAPAVALAAALISQEDPEAVMLVLPADHAVDPVPQFRNDLKLAFEVAESTDVLVTFGVRPSRAETGYGYLERGEPFPSFESGRVYQVNSFREKPDPRTASDYLRQGRFYWNAGIFAWRADVILDELDRYRPAMVQAARRVAAAARKDFPRALRSYYSRVERISIDYAVMEKSTRVAMVEAGFNWDDLGSHLAWERLLKRDRAGNTYRGEAVALETESCVLMSDDGLVAALGVQNIVVIRTKDATLVCAKDRADEVRALVARMATEKRFKKYL
ncbi:MAG TPA: sugar phosphate nucleotidyltransferase [Candidatus Saccharimonadales bacterium]|nr:sugar phosphate nucleotidyltransferase [Candidatus Saccharimonadales bacterium]